MTYPHTPGHKGHDTTGCDAAAAIGFRHRELRNKVLQTIRYNAAGLTADECAEALGEDVLSIRPRVSELGTLGLIQRTTGTRRNASGRAARVWRVAEGKR